MPLIVIYGNGSTEHRLIPEIMNRLGFRKEYIEPQIAGGTIGLKAAIDSVAVLLNRRATPRYYLIIIDREHVPGKNTIEDQLVIRGFTQIQFETLYPNYAWNITCRRGAKQATIYIVALGTEQTPYIEGNISKLIQLEYDEYVEPLKKKIREWLRRRNMRDRDLIKQATRTNIEEAFKPLVTTLSKIAEEDP